MGLGEGRGVSVTDVVHSIDPRKIMVESRAIVLEGRRGGGFALGFGSGRREVLGFQGGAGGGSAYPM